MRRFRSLSLLSAGLFLILTQTSCGVLAHNVGRLMRIPSSVLSLEETTPTTSEEALPPRDATAPTA